MNRKERIVEKIVEQVVNKLQEGLQPSEPYAGTPGYVITSFYIKRDGAIFSVITKNKIITQLGPDAVIKQHYEDGTRYSRMLLATFYGPPKDYQRKYLVNSTKPLA